MGAAAIATVIVATTTNPTIKTAKIPLSESNRSMVSSEDDDYCASKGMSVSIRKSVIKNGSQLGPRARLRQVVSRLCLIRARGIIAIRQGSGNRASRGHVVRF